MKKVGIVSLYYHNHNYGGLLQAYALTKHIQSIGCDAYQIAYRKEKNTESKLKRIPKLVKELSLKGMLLKVFQKSQGIVENQILQVILGKKASEQFEKRRDAFELFQEFIPHTDVYIKETISEINNAFDVFICGSDQIWKTGVGDDVFFLKFVKGKKKFSYAASIGRSKLDIEDELEIIENIKELDAISVREAEAKDLFDKYDIHSEVVVDPTLLLSVDEWDQLEKPIDVPKEYIFCYFLGMSNKQRKFVKRYAKEKGLPIVSLPYLSGRMGFADWKFADIDLFSVTPNQFIYLVKHSAFVFTDSYHATVFSCIYGKNFRVFEREDEKTMNGRVIHLLELLDLKNNFGYGDITELNETFDIRLNENYKNLKEFSQRYIDINIR